MLVFLKSLLLQALTSSAIIMKIFIVGDECPAKVSISAVLADVGVIFLLPSEVEDIAFVEKSKATVCKAKGIAFNQKGDAVVYIAERPDLYIVGLLRFISNTLVTVCDYDLGSELFVPFSDFEGFASEILPAAIKVADFIRGRLDFFERLSLAQRQILELMLLGYTKEEVVYELSISSSWYHKQVNRMKESFEVANDQTLICCLYLSGYANQIIRSSF